MENDKVEENLIQDLLFDDLKLIETLKNSGALDYSNCDCSDCDCNGQ